MKPLCLLLFLLFVAAFGRVFEDVPYRLYKTLSPYDEGRRFMIYAADEIDLDRHVPYIKMNISDLKKPFSLLVLTTGCIKGGHDKIAELIIKNSKTVGIESGAITGSFAIETLVITHNPIKRLPAKPFDLPFLKTLILSNNQLEYLDPNAFAGLPRMEKLDLSRNRIRVLPSTIFKFNPKLLYITLNWNLIRVIEDGTFASMKNFIEDINLNENGLINVSTNAFADNVRIENLTLAGNPLTDIKLSDKLRGIIRLDVRRNNIKCVYARNVKKVLVLKADGNPWRCDCLKSFLNEKAERNEIWAPQAFQNCGMRQYRIKHIDV